MIQRIINDLLSFVLKKLKEPTSSSNSYFERSTSLSSSSSSSSSTGGSTFLDLRSSLLNRCLSSLFYKQTQNGMTNITSRLVLNNFDYKNIINDISWNSIQDSGCAFRESEQNQKKFSLQC